MFGVLSNKQAKQQRQQGRKFSVIGLKLTKHNVHRASSLSSYSPSPCALSLMYTPLLIPLNLIRNAAAAAAQWPLSGGITSQKEKWFFSSSDYNTNVKYTCIEGKKYAYIPLEAVFRRKSSLTGFFILYFPPFSAISDVSFSLFRFFPLFSLFFCLSYYTLLLRKGIIDLCEPINA